MPSAGGVKLPQVDKGSLELLLSRGLSYEEIGRRFGRHPSTVASWARRYGLASSHAARHSPKGGLDRAKVEMLIHQHASIARIAQELESSESTVKYWLQKWGIATIRAVKTDRSRVARRRGHAHLSMECRRHGRTTFSIEGRGSYRCLRCRSEAVADRRRRAKATLVEEAGASASYVATTRAWRRSSSIIATPRRRASPSRLEG
jgi:transposase